MDPLLEELIYVVVAGVVTYIVAHLKHLAVKKALEAGKQASDNQGDELLRIVEAQLATVKALWPGRTEEIETAEKVVARIKGVWNDEEASDEEMREATQELIELLKTLRVIGS